jgi:hypothetical protein
VATKLALLSRVSAGVLGGYALASAGAVLLGALLPGPRAEAVLAGAQASFALYTGAVVWAFAVHDLRRVWLGLLLPTLAMAAVGFYL